MNSYAITITASPSKFIGKNRKFHQLTCYEQQILISDVLNSALAKVGLLDNLHYNHFEMQKNGMTHSHGMFSVPKDFEELEDPAVEEVQKYVHKKLGMPKLPPHICCFIEKTKAYKEAWLTYATKDQEEDNNIDWSKNIFKK